MAFRVGIVQFNPVRKNIQQNIRTIKKLIVGIKADLLVLPELANSGYLYESPDALTPYAETSDGSGPFLAALQNMAKSTSGVIISGYAEREKGHLFNSSVAVSGNEILQNYRKTHLFDHEKLLFSPGDTGFSLFQIDEVKVGMMICFDWIFPESARTLSLLGAQIIAHPANLVLPFCQDAMITRSIENHIYIITANRIGQEKLRKTDLKFTGKSQITSPFGKVLYQGPKSQTAIHTMEIEPDLARSKMINFNNDLFQDRRPEYYM
jgi:predicted amidohydrolase